MNREDSLNVCHKLLLFVQVKIKFFAKISWLTRDFKNDFPSVFAFDTTRRINGVQTYFINQVRCQQH